jgi:ParB-like chromosome segregation protein Spo0J
MPEFYENTIAQVADLIPYAMNSRTHSEEQVAQIAASIREFGFTNPVLIDEENNLIAGHGRVLAARKLNLDQVPAVVVTGLDENRRRALVIADNKLALNAEWDQEKLVIELQSMSVDMQQLAGFSQDELLALLKPAQGEGDNEKPPQSLADRFGIPPFSVFNAREGWWQNRKRAWLALGIASELGRGEHLIPNGGGQREPGTLRQGEA